MCGIYAAIERGGFSESLCDGKCATKTIFKGLKDVEYRGYDNWGMVVLGELPEPGIQVGYQVYDSNGLLLPEKKGLLVEKRAGKMPKDTLLPCSNIGLGHTRWATHGGKTDENSHPHLDCSGSLAIVHNGMVENHEELWAELQGHTHRSQTDTELIVHHIERERSAHPDMPLAIALRRVHERLMGNNAVFATDGHSVAGIAFGSPMVVGRTETGYVGSSDELALARYTTMTYTLPPRTLVSFNDHAIIYGNNELTREIEPIPFKQNAQEPHQEVSMDEFDTFFEKEICETPRVLKRLLEDRTQQMEVARILSKAEMPILTGCGSAGIAAEIIGKLMTQIAKKRVSVVPASEFNDLKETITEEDVIVPLSQSGTTIDILDETRAAQERGAKIVAFVNVRNSALDQEADASMHLKTGTEMAVVASKSFSAMVASGLLVAYAMAGDPDEGERVLLENIKAAQEVIHRRDEIKKIVDQLYQEGKLDVPMFTFGRGISASIAREAALKGSESAEVSLQGFPGGEFKHGMMAMIKEYGTPMFAIVPNDKLASDMMNNVSQVRSRGGVIIGLGPENRDQFDHHILVPEAGASSVIANAVAVQLIGLYMAQARGKDCDKPNNLAKSVTVK